MKKKRFIKYIEELKLFLEEREKLDDVIKAISPSSTGVVEIGGSFIDAYISAVEEAFNIDDDMLSWFVFENDFGREEMVVSMYRKDFKIKNEEDFYNLFINQ